MNNPGKQQVKPNTNFSGVVMKNLILSFVLLFAFAIDAVQAQTLTVRTIQFGTDIENRQLVGMDSIFSNNIGTVYCYTHITGARDATDIVHIWYYEDEEKARVPLTVKSESWRTWSSKTIQPVWTGKWQVVVVDANGKKLASDSFHVKEN